MEWTDAISYFCFNKTIPSLYILFIFKGEAWRKGNMTLVSVRGQSVRKTLIYETNIASVLRINEFSALTLVSTSRSPRRITPKLLFPSQMSLISSSLIFAPSFKSIFSLTTDFTLEPVMKPPVFLLFLSFYIRDSA